MESGANAEWNVQSRKGCRRAALMLGIAVRPRESNAPGQERKAIRRPVEDMRESNAPGQELRQIGPADGERAIFLQQPARSLRQHSGSGRRNHRRRRERARVPILTREKRQNSNLVLTTSEPGFIFELRAQVGFESRGIR